MPEHKMLIIDNIRVRPEDADRYLPQAPAPARAAAAPADAFDPAAVAAEQVLTYLGTVGETEALRVLDAEAAGKKPRTGILGKREQLLTAARERDAAGAGGAS
jgi:hypothetical protein